MRPPLYRRVRRSATLTRCAAAAFSSTTSSRSAPQQHQQPILQHNEIGNIDTGDEQHDVPTLKEIPSLPIFGSVLIPASFSGKSKA